MSRLAREAGLNRSAISMALHEQQQMSFAAAVEIEKATGGLVRCEDVYMSDANRKAARYVRNRGAA